MGENYNPKIHSVANPLKLSAQDLSHFRQYFNGNTTRQHAYSTRETEHYYIIQYIYTAQMCKNDTAIKLMGHSSSAL